MRTCSVTSDLSHFDRCYYFDPTRPHCPHNPNVSKHWNSSPHSPILNRLSLSNSKVALKGRAEQFRNVLWADPDLRETYDRQWTYFNRLRYMLRFSLFRRRLLVTWFPQVLVSFWVMTALYIRERQELRHAPVTDYLKVAVKESLKEMNKHGLKPITVYSRDGLYKVVVSVDELKQLGSDLDSLFR